MKYIDTEKLTNEEKKNLFSIWNREYPTNIAFNTLEQFEQYLQSLVDPVHTLVYDTDKLLGWSCKFARDNAPWFLIILDSNVQGMGLGSKLLLRLKQKNSELFGWVVDHELYIKKNGERYSPPLPFYLKNGFSVLEERFETSMLSAIKIQWIKRDTISKNR